MISKASQRGGGRQLATHLLNRFDNESVELADLRGSSAPDLHGAVHEWYAQSLATKCQKFLYHLIISPDVAKYDLTREQYLDFIARTERSLKLVGQPRAIVFHVKNGREHVHAVWSRIDTEAGKAVHIAFDRMKRRQIAQEFARDHGLPLPEGMRENGTKDRFNEKAKQSDHAEKQQEERSGERKEDRREAILRAWKESPNAAAFVKALEHAGYWLARGDKRAYVVIDLAGAVHSLTRQLTPTVKAKEVTALLKTEYAPETLPDIATAKEQAQKRLETLKAKADQDLSPEQQRSQDDPARTVEARQAEPDGAQRIEKEITARRAALGRLQEERRSVLAEKRTELSKRQEAEYDGLKELHASEDRGILSARAFRQPKGLRSFLMRVTGFEMIISVRHRREDAVRAAAQKQQKAALQNRHGRECQDFDRQYRDLAALEKRERYSLETAFKREEFQRIAQPLRARETPPKSPIVLKPAFDRAVSTANIRHDTDADRMAALKALFAREFAKTAEPAKEARPPVVLKPEFDRVASGPDVQREAGEDNLAPAKGRAKRDFANAVDPDPKARQPVVLKPEFDRVAGDPTANQTSEEGGITAKTDVKRDFTTVASPDKDPRKSDADGGVVKTPVPLTNVFNGVAGGGKESLPDTFNRHADPQSKTETGILARARRLKEALDRLRDRNRDRTDGGPDWER